MPVASLILPLILIIIPKRINEWVPSIESTKRLLNFEINNTSETNQQDKNYENLTILPKQNNESRRTKQEPTRKRINEILSYWRVQGSKGTATPSFIQGNEYPKKTGDIRVLIDFRELKHRLRSKKRKSTKKTDLRDNWTIIEQQAFLAAKNMLIKEAMLNYPVLQSTWKWWITYITPKPKLMLKTITHSRTRRMWDTISTANKGSTRSYSIWALPGWKRLGTNGTVIMICCYWLVPHFEA